MILRYNFHKIINCNMCGFDASKNKIIGRRLNHSQGIFPKWKNGITVSIARCNKCGLIYSDPQPIPINIQDHYGIPPESYWTENYFRISDDYFLNELNTYERLAVTNSRICLDIGAGLGKGIIAMEKRGYDVYGFEPSEPFYEQGIKRMKMNKAKYQLASMENIVYNEDYFDFITFGAVLEHLYDPAFCISKALSWLKPNGLIHIEVPSAHWLTNKIVNTVYKIMGSDYVANLSPMHNPYHLYEFTLNSFKKYSEISGDFLIAHHEFYVCPEFTYLPKILTIFTEPIMKYTNTGMQLCVWLRKNL